MRLKSRGQRMGWRSTAGWVHRSGGPVTPRSYKPRFEVLENRTLLSAGDLDPSFGMAGTVTTPLQGALASQGQAAGVQSDGKIVLAGSVFNPLTLGWGLARYTPDGILDSGFGNRGTVITTFAPAIAGNTYNEATAVAIQGDGRIIVAGHVILSALPNSSYLGLARYNPDGSLDVSFGTAGTVVSSIHALIPDMALQPDGRIVVSFLATALNQDQLVRFNSDGSLDSTFGAGGVVTLPFSAGRSPRLSIQPDGRIIAVGWVGTQNSASFAVARYDTNGNLDASFGTGGVVTTKFATDSFDAASAIVIQPDLKIVVGGSSSPPAGTTSFALARYNSDGSLDTSFGSGGKLLTSGFALSIPSHLALQSDGAIVAAGGSISVSPPDTFFLFFNVARFSPSGMLDTSFGTQGKVTGSSFEPGDGASVVLVDGSRIVLAGQTGDSLTDSRFALLGFTPTGIPDVTFGTGGQVATAVLGATPSTPDAVLIQPDGKIIVAGTTPELLSPLLFWPVTTRREVLMQPSGAVAS